MPVEDESPGHVIRYNFISDTGNPASGITMGIYLDNWASQCLVQGHIVVNTSPTTRSYSILVKGRNNIIENNILVNTAYSHICMMAHCYYPEFATVVARNIMCNLSGEIQAFFDLADSAHLWRVVAESDYNLFFQAGTDSPVIVRSVPRSDEHGEMYGDDVEADGLRLADWRKVSRRGEDVYDIHSIVADPLFVDAENGDYRLKPDSPALKLGFQPIDVARIGIRRKAPR